MRGFVKKKTTRIVGIVTILTLALIIGVVTAVATSATPAAKAATTVRVAIYCDAGSNPADTVATFRALQACGFDIYGIGIQDIAMGRLTTSNYDVLLLPAGASDDRIWYYDTTYGFSADMKQDVDDFAADGGGVVGIEGGANFMCADTGTPAHSLNLYGGSYTPGYTVYPPAGPNPTPGLPGKTTITYTDSDFGSGTQEIYKSYGTGTIAACGASGDYGASTTIATTPEYGDSIMCATYAGAGHVVVCSVLPELRGDSTLDWTIWDNWVMGGTQANSIGCWSLLGRMINWAYNGTATAPTMTTYANPAGRKIGILTSLEFYGTGGVYPAYLPSLFLAVAASGNLPLSVRASEINGVFLSNLTTANFDAFILPDSWFGDNGVGETAEAKDLGAAGATAIKNFAASGGGVMGIGEGSTGYLSADYWAITDFGSPDPKDWNFNACTFNHPATLFGGSTVYYQVAGWPWQLDTVTTSGDPVIGTLNSGVGVQSFNIDRPTFYGLDFTDTLSQDGATVVSTYDDYPVINFSADSGNEPADIRCLYPTDGDPAAQTAGHVLLSSPDHNLLSGSDDDWTTWDNYVWWSNTPLVNPDNPKPWDFIDAALNHWVACPTPTVTSDHDTDTDLHHGPVTVTLTADDSGNNGHAGPGIDKTQYRVAGSGTWLDTTADQFTDTTNGTTIYEYRALDNAGNASATGTCTIKISTAKPTVIDDASGGWSSTDVTVTLTADDTGGPGIDKTQYRLAGSGTWLDTTANQFTVDAPSDHSNDGANNYEYRALDTDGFASDTGTCTVNIDTSGAPTVTDTRSPSRNTHGWNTGDVTMTLNPVSNGGPAIQKTQYRLAGSGTWLDTTANQFVVSAPVDDYDVYDYEYRALDAGDNASQTGTCTVNIDTTEPTVTSDHDADASWHNAPVTVTLTPVDSDGPGIDKTQYRVTGTTDWIDAASNQFDVLAPADGSNNGTHTYDYRALNTHGIASDTGTCTVNIDTTNPTVTDNAPTGWITTNPVTVTLSPADAGGSGVQKTQYRVAGSGTWIDTTAGQFTDSTENTTNYQYRALDNAGNVSTPVGTCTVNIDTVKPTVTNNAPTGWNNSDVTVPLIAHDSCSGVAKTQYRVTGTTSWTDATYNQFDVPAPADHSNDGTHSYDYRAIDVAGNVSDIGTCTVKIDTTAPTVTDNAPAWSNTAATVTLSAADSLSGVAKTQYRAGTSGSWTDGSSFIVAAPANHSNDGAHSYQYRALDNAGNVSAVTSTTGTCTVNIDTTGPTTAGKAASGKKGYAISLKYRITDKLSPSATAVTLTVKNAKGKLVKSFKLATKATNKWLTVKWTPKAKGSYNYSITAKDLAGNKQTKAPVSKITVK